MPRLLHISMQKRHAGTVATAGNGQEKLLPIGIADIANAIKGLARRYWSTTVDITFP